MEKLTKKQQRVYDFIKEFMLKNNVTPSTREIAKGVGLSSLSTVNTYMKALRKAGAVIPYNEDSIRYSVEGIKMVEADGEDRI